MVALKIEDIKTFTSKLLIGENFDSFLLREAEIVTYNRFTIDGRIRQGYYSGEELEIKKIEDFSSWKTVRPVCYSLIKGNRLPVSFQIVLHLPLDGVASFVKVNQIALSPEQVTGLYLNIRYEEGQLCCVTGTSVAVFTMDKSINRAWDEEVRQLFKREGIACQEM